MIEGQEVWISCVVRFGMFIDEYLVRLPQGGAPFMVGSTSVEIKEEPTDKKEGRGYLRVKVLEENRGYCKVLLPHILYSVDPKTRVRIVPVTLLIEGNRSDLP